MVAGMAELLDWSARNGKPPPDGGGSHGHGLTDLSSPGIIIGTLQYGARAARWRRGGQRTDIFAFGALLHEMITGKRAFDGKSRVLLISAIATAHPEPLSALEPAASPALRACAADMPGQEPGGSLADGA